MRALLITTIIFGSIPFILRRPFVGVAMWCWISYMVPHRLAFGFVQQFPVAMIIAMTFLFAYAFSKEPKKIPIKAPVIWLIFFYVWMFLCFLVHEKTSFAVELGIKIVKIQLFTLIILAMLTTKKRIDLTLWVIALSIGFFGLKGGLFTIATGGSGRVWGPPGGFFEGNNELGLTLIMNIPILVYLMTTVSNVWIKRALLGVIIFSVIAVLGTHSRGALLAASACGAFLWMNSRKKVVTGLAIILVIPIVLSIMPQKWFDRMDTIVESNEEDYDGSVRGRFNAWRMAFNLASDRFFGGGFDATTRENFYLYAPDPDDFHDSHSIYFQTLGKHGFPGLFLFLMLWLSTWRLAGRMKKKYKEDEHLKWASTLGGMMQVSLIAYCTGGAFLGLAYFDLPYHILITVVAASVIAHQQSQNRNDTPIETEIPVTDQRALPVSHTLDRLRA